jgi:hypothetical protein
VFVGRVEHVAEPFRRDGYKKPDAGYDAHFVVEEAFQGVTPNETVVVNGGGHGNCSFPFLLGERFLVFAHAAPVVKGASPRVKSLSTHGCSGTRPLSDAREIVDLFRALASTGPEIRIFGTVWLVDGKPRPRALYFSPPTVAGLTVRLEGPSGPMETETDGDGYYRFVGLLPGSYQIRFVLAAGYVKAWSESSEFRVQVDERGCGAEVSFSVRKRKK